MRGFFPGAPIVVVYFFYPSELHDERLVRFKVPTSRLDDPVNCSRDEGWNRLPAREKSL